MMLFFFIYTHYYFFNDTSIKNKLFYSIYLYFFSNFTPKFIFKILIPYLYTKINYYNSFLLAIYLN